LRNSREPLVLPPRRTDNRIVAVAAALLLLFFPTPLFIITCFCHVFEFVCMSVCRWRRPGAKLYFFVLSCGKKNHSFARTHTLTHIQKRARLFVNHIIIICLCHIYIYFHFIFGREISHRVIITEVRLPCNYCMRASYSTEGTDIWIFDSESGVKRILHTYFINLFLIILCWKYYIIRDLKM